MKLFKKTSLKKQMEAMEELFIKASIEYDHWKSTTTDKGGLSTEIINRRVQAQQKRDIYSKRLKRIQTEIKEKE